MELKSLSHLSGSLEINFTFIPFGRGIVMRITKTQYFKARMPNMLNSKSEHKTSDFSSS